jgi:PAP2 superfamily
MRHRSTASHARLRAAFVTLGATVTLGILACAPTGGSSSSTDQGATDAAPLHDAMHQLSNVMVYDIFSPPQASRTYAYASIAAFEAMRPSDTTYRSLAGMVNGLTPPPAPPAGEVLSYPLAGVHAFMTVGQALTFSRARMDSLRAAMDERFERRLPRDVVRASIAYGDTIAHHILKWAAEDRFKESRGWPKYSVTAARARWIPTPPAYMDAVEPHWGQLRPFVMDTGSQFRPEPPLPFDTTATSPFMREVREVYEVKAALTDEQKEILAFWDCNPYVMHVQGHTMFATKKITPGGHWMGIVGVAARKAGADALRSADAYARTAIALADGFISSWDEKYRSSLLRPETVINRYLDESWTPMLQTPPFPEYTSGHSVISNAAATVLTHVFGDNFAFSDSTELEFGLPVRSFGSFEEAAAEAAISRLYGGIHYRRAIDQGSLQGKRVGELVVRRVRTRGSAPVLAAAAAPVGVTRRAGTARGSRSTSAPDVR